MRAIPATLLLLLLAAPAAADGFHNPILTEKNPREWAATVRETLGLDRSDSAEEPDAVGAVDRRAGAGNLAENLRYLDRRNIILREFPDFDHDKIPGFKDEIESLLIALGGEAAPVLANTLATDLRGAGGNAGLLVAEDFRERIARILVRIGPPALPSIRRHLEDKDSRVQVAFLGILRKIVVDPDFGTDLPKWRRWFEIRDLAVRGKGENVPALVELLTDSDDRIRRAAAGALGEIGDRSAVPALLRLLSDRPHAETIREAARALVKIGDDAAIPDLIALLGDGRRDVRAEAATALRFITKEHFGFDPDAPAEPRAAAIDRWRAWWRARRK